MPLNLHPELLEMVDAERGRLSREEFITAILIGHMSTRLIGRTDICAGHALLNFRARASRWFKKPISKWESRQNKKIIVKEI